MLGLTGGIGSGKSTVARMFRERGAAVFDADAVAREVVEPGGPAYDAVVRRFGAAVLQPDGSIDRPTLAAVVFADDQARADLNAVVHPEVHAEIRRRLSALPDRVAVIEAPLLIEAGWHADLVVVVEAPEEVAIHRAAEGRGMSPDDVRRRMAAQTSPGARRARADYVIDNAGSIDDLDAEVDRVWAAIGRRRVPQDQRPPRRSS